VVTRVRARGEEFRIVRVVGNLFVCSRANGNCCCGWTEKGRMPFDNSLWSDEWERRRLRNRVHLTFTGCLGPCVVGNNALLQLFGRSVWFKDLNEPHLAGRVFDYIEAALADGALGAVPDDLRGHVYERYLTPADAPPEMTFSMIDGDRQEQDEREVLDGLDPVCLMDVDPVTASFTVEHEGRTYAFCGPGCRREFVEDPAAFVGGTRRPAAAR
jgi:cobaltochelatase CobN